MPWRAFAIFNLLGAASWVTVIASAGYLFGRHWPILVRTVRRFDLAVVLVSVVVILFLWWRHTRQSQLEDP
jgi:membrane protein DedA with SNARE-associated domain